MWVDEGDYQVYFRTIAENAPPDYTTQPDANTNLSHHVATDIEPVEVIGRVYDFHITDIADYNWETVFRKQKEMRHQAARPIGQDSGTLTARPGERAAIYASHRSGQASGAGV